MTPEAEAVEIREWVRAQLATAPQLTPALAERLSRMFFPDGRARLVRDEEVRS